MPDAKPDRPNVLLIMADQLRPDWLGVAGGPARTPHIDQLAESGVRFTHCYTNAPVCAPARVGLAAGLHPMRLGGLDNYVFLPVSRPTYYQHLRDRGYHVGCVGKLDLAKPDDFNGRDGDRPAAYGFGFTRPIELEGKMHAGQHPEPRGRYGFWLEEQGLYQTFHEDYKRRMRNGWSIDTADSPLPTEAFEDIHIGNESVRWIEEADPHYPFHLFVSFVGPHDPFDPPTEFAEHYRGAAMPEPIPPADEAKPQWVRNRSARLERQGRTAEQIAEARRQYSAATEAIDVSVGRILDALDRKGLRDNTIILFCADHGEMLGDHGLYTKNVAYEASWNVPLIATGPGIEATGTSDALIELIDVGATVCDLATGSTMPNVDARSFRPLLQGDTEAHRDDVVCQLRPFRAIFDGRCKLIQNVNDADELYDLQSDPDERENRIADEPDRVRELGRRMEQRFGEDKWLR